MERSVASGRGVGVLVACLALWLVIAPWARAAPAFSPPSGWEQGATASDQARRRADAWAKAWDGDVRQVMSTRAEDGFAETLAVLDVPAPVPAEALADLEAARAWLEPRMIAALGSTATLEPDGLELRPRPEPGVKVLRARVRQDDRVAHVAIAPTGTRHLALVLLLPRAEEVLYAGVLDDAIDGLDGLHRPVAPLRRGLLRTVALLSWLLVGSAFGFAWARRSLPLPGARVAGRQAAAALGATALLVLVLAGTLLGDAAVELALAGTTPWGFALELAAGGVVMAGLVLAGTELWERQLRPVASAPESGTYAASRRGGASPLGPVAPPPLRPVITGDTHVGPPPAAPAITGDTQVGRPPAVTGDTQVGPPPAVTGNTKVGPPPRPGAGDGSPPVREIISGDIEVQTQVRRVPEADTVKTSPPRAPDPSADEDTNPRAVPDAPDEDTNPRALPERPDEDTNPRALPGSADGPASLGDPGDPPRGGPARRSPLVDPSRPAAARDAARAKLEIDWS